MELPVIRDHKHKNSTNSVKEKRGKTRRINSNGSLGSVDSRSSRLNIPLSDRRNRMRRSIGRERTSSRGRFTSRVEFSRNENPINIDEKFAPRKLTRRVIEFISMSINNCL